MGYVSTGHKTSGLASGVVSTTLTLPGTTAGNLVVVVTLANRGGGPAANPTVTDGGNTWTKETTVTLDPVNIGISWSILTTGGTRTIATNGNGVNGYDLWAAAHEFAGPHATPKSGSNVTTSGTSQLADTTAMTPADSDPLVVAVTTCAGTGVIIENVAPGDGTWTLSADNETGVAPGSVLYRIVPGAPGTPRAAWLVNEGGANTWLTYTMAFKPATAAPAVLAFPSTGIVDNTTRANEAVLSNGGYWGDVANAQLLSNRIQAATPGNFHAYSTASYGPDAEVYMTVNTLPGAGGSLYLFLRLSSNYYYCEFFNYLASNAFQGARLIKGVASVESTLVTTPGTVGLAPGGQMGFRVIGSTLTAYVNGTAVLTTTDSAVTGSGVLGFHGWDNITRYSAIGGGTIAAFPSTGLIDNTTRANENPLSNGGVWSPVVNTQLLSNQIKAVTNTTFYALTAAQTSSADCEIYVTLAAHPAAGNTWQLYVRHTPAAGGSNYTLNLNSYAGSNTYTSVTLLKTVAGTNTTLATVGSTVIAPGAQLGLKIVGTVLTGFLNGTSFITATDGANSVPNAGQLVFLGQDTTIAFTQVGGGPMGAPPQDTADVARAMHSYAMQRS